MEDQTTQPDSEASVPEVVFDQGLPGFPDAKRFVLTPWGDPGGPFSMLRCLDDHIEFLVAVPGSFFPDYAPELDDETAADLGIASADDAIVLVVITVPDRAENATANLLGPLVINRHSNRGVQAVLNERWSTRELLFPPVTVQVR